MKKAMIALLIPLAALLLCACRQQPPEGLVKENPENAAAIEALPWEDAALELSDTLYFGYGDTGMLRQESRQITMLPNEAREKALVRALLEGSREAGSRALFPEKAEVLSTQAQDGVIYITFNEAFYDRYADEDPDWEAAALRRRLAMDALTATLTESGEYRCVQVLVRAEENVGKSMRLTTRFFREEPEVIVPPLTRQSVSLPTPAACAKALLSAWQERSVDGLTPFVSLRNGQAQTALNGDLENAPALLAFTVYDGTVSPDGGSAVVCADLTLRDADGFETALNACPLRLIRESGVWKILRAQLTDIMGENND